MRRFFGNIIDNRIVLSEESLKHAQVIRLNKGENVEIVANNEVYICMVISYNPYEFKIIEKQDSKDSRELTYKVILLLPLLKRENFELVLQKATELGVNTIYPYISSRVIKRINANEFEEKRERYEKIILNAAEQSNRNLIPHLEKLYKLEDLPTLFNEVDNKFIAYEDEALKGKKITIDPTVKKEVVIICGPEGGFSKNEVDLFINNNFKVVSLGKRILRAETACIYSLSIVSYLIE